MGDASDQNAVLRTRPDAAIEPDVASFNSQDLDRLDWQILQNGWVSMYWREKLLEADVQWLADHAYRIYRVDCRRWSSDQSALVDIGVALGFPDYYGPCLDAFNDCLWDLEVPDEGGAAIVLHRYDHFVQQSPATAHAILDIIARNARSFMLFGRRLLTLVQSDDPRLSFDPVGATSVWWNPDEWLDKRRGI